MKKQDIIYYCIVGMIMLVYLFICYYTTSGHQINLVVPYVFLGAAIFILSVAHKKLLRR